MSLKKVKKVNTRKVVVVHMDIEVTDTTREPNVLVREESLASRKLFISDYSEVEGKVEGCIQRALSCTFDSSNVEAREYYASSLIYYHTAQTESTILFVTVEIDNEKVEFPDYMPADRYA